LAKGNHRLFATAGGIASALAIVALLVVSQPSFLSLSSNSNNTVADDNLPKGELDTGNPDNSSNKVVQTVALKQYQIENRTRVIVDRSAFLGPNDAYAFEVNVPNENVTFLEGTITVEGKEYVQGSFLGKFNGSYCQIEDQCTFKVYGSQSGKKAEDVYHNVHLLVNPGDSILLGVKNSPSADLQIVKVTLIVSYPVVVEKTADPALVQVAQGTKHEEESGVEIKDKDSPPSSLLQPAAKSLNPNIDELREFALEKINEDRKKYDLPPVMLSDNQAAQIHAEDVLKTKQISHWMTNGEKPYMTYTRYGGTGSVGQNVGLSGDKQYAQDCASVFYMCHPMDPFREIENHEYNMMYDDAESNWGHRDNIIDKRHTHVSIGIAYSDYAFVIVQNFENHYIKFSQSIVTDDNKEVHLVGQIDPVFKLYNILIYYDELPSASIYENYKAQRYYEMGDMVAGVVPPDGSYYPTIKTIVASKWNEKNGAIDIRFNLSDEKPGVYTVMLWLEDDKRDQFDATTYSVFIG
jgi:cysteine-rich secretory family protein